jgi:hypothetical protein
MEVPRLCLAIAGKSYVDGRFTAPPENLECTCVCVCVFCVCCCNLHATCMQRIVEVDEIRIEYACHVSLSHSLP